MRFLNPAKDHAIDCWIYSNLDAWASIPRSQLYNTIYKNEPINTDIDKENSYSIKESQSTGNNSKEICVLQKLTPETDVQLWSPFSKVTNKILKPQVFHHHVIAEAANEYNLYEDLTCPGVDLSVPLTIRKGEANRDASLKPKYYRINGDGNIQQCLCRMCSHEKWIRYTDFYQHMALAHGVVLFEDSQNHRRIMAIPNPLALFCIHSTKKMKRYYCKCPLCKDWVRLGFLGSLRTLGRFTRAGQEQTQLGLYTNYYLHYMQCASQADILELLRKEMPLDENLEDLLPLLRMKGGHVI